MTTKREYMEKLATNVGSGVPLLVTRTREPHKAIEAAESFVQYFNQKVIKHNADNSDTMPGYSFGRWDAVEGWTHIEFEDYEQRQMGLSVEEKKPNGMVDLLGAMQEMIQVFPDGVYTMCWPQDGFVSGTVKAFLLHIAHMFSKCRKRLILVVPESASIPYELQDFIHYLEYGVPSEDERVPIIGNVFTIYQSQNVKMPGKEIIKTISSAGAGMTGFELGNTVSRAIKTLLKQNEETSAENVSKLVLAQKAEMVKNSEALTIMEEGTIDEIGGLELLKEWVKLRVACFTPEAQAYGIDTPKGIVLGGPPGTGKSACAKAIAYTLKLPLYKFDMSNLFGSLVGESEEKTEKNLKMLEAMSPCVVLLDELDKMFSTRDGGDGGSSRRMLGKVLTFLQETKFPIFFIGTFNKADGLPPELLRKGRFDEIFAVTTPTHEERLEIFKIHLKKRKQDPDAISDLGTAVGASDGYVAAELEAAVKEALVVAYNTQTELTGSLIADQFASMVPLSRAFEAEFRSMEQWAAQNARPASRGALVKGSIRSKRIVGAHKKPTITNTNEGRIIDDM